MRAAQLVVRATARTALNAARAPKRALTRAVDALPTRAARRARAEARGLSDEALARFLAPDWKRA